MTADLKTELYFLKKDAEDIEAVMSSAYRLYEHLEAQHADEALTSLALSSPGRPRGEEGQPAHHPGH